MDLLSLVADDGPLDTVKEIEFLLLFHQLLTPFKGVLSRKPLVVVVVGWWLFSTFDVLVNEVRHGSTFGVHALAPFFLQQMDFLVDILLTIRILMQKVDSIVDQLSGLGLKPFRLRIAAIVSAVVRAFFEHLPALFLHLFLDESRAQPKRAAGFRMYRQIQTFWLPVLVVVCAVLQFVFGLAVRVIGTLGVNQDLFLALECPYTVFTLRIFFSTDQYCGVVQLIAPVEV